MRGRTISTRVSDPVNILYPIPSVCPKNIIPKRPNIIDGIPESVSVANSIPDTNFPGFAKVGVIDLLFGTEWAPTAADPKYGILYIILTSIIGTAVSILIGVPIALLTAVFLTEVSNKKLSAIVQPAVELLAAIPSVIYGLLGLMILNPIMYKLEKYFFEGSTTHQFTGGSNLLAAIIVLAIMILPTVINMSVSAIKAVPQQMRSASLALGATKIQTIFKVTIPAAKSGIMTGIVLGIGRALGVCQQHGSRLLRHHRRNGYAGCP